LGTSKTTRINNALTNSPGKFVVTFSELPRRRDIASAISGVATRVSAPIMTPERVLTPAKTAPVSKEKERESGKALGETVLIVIAKTPPARPARPELTVKAKVFDLPT